MILPDSDLAPAPDPAPDLAGVEVTPEILALVPRPLAVRHGVLPLGRDARGLRLAVTEWPTPAVTDELAFVAGCELVPALAPGPELRAAISRCYGPEPGPSGTPATTAEESPDGIEADESDAPVIGLVKSIVEEGVRRRASDIHFEPLARRFRVRYRIDGALVEAGDPPHRLQAAVISRLKIMAGLSLAEKRTPQDGRWQLALQDGPLDLRASSLPTTHGESIVLRVLDRRELRGNFAELGLAGDDATRFERLVSRADGMVLVTGPTGSGKTTTLYHCLQRFNRTGLKVITVEDPVEYQLTGVNQVQVRPDIGLTFGAALRAMLRQAPNVIMVGEIRDHETASMALNAALTGHLVLSTLHTNDAPGAVTRLLEMGVPPFLLAGSLRGVLAQRLVRRVCERCARPAASPPPELRALGIGPDGATGLREGAGCPACGGTGYRGRLGLFELLTADPGLEKLIKARAGRVALQAYARSHGCRSLREDGARKATAGLTTAVEVVSITASDDPRPAPPQTQERP